MAILKIFQVFKKFFRFPPLQNAPAQKKLAEFRPAGRNKMEIHFIRRLCRPEKYFSPRKCGICAPMAHKLCAQSRRNPFCQKSVSFFDRLKQGSFRCPVVVNCYEISIHLTLPSSLAKVMLNTRPPGVTMVRK